MAVYPKSLYKNEERKFYKSQMTETPIIPERSRQAQERSGKGLSRDNILSRYITYIYLPIGGLALLALIFISPLWAFITLGVWASGYVVLSMFDSGVYNVKKDIVR